MPDTTILYLTDNTLEDSVGPRVREVIRDAANGTRIVSVSQKPIHFGDNVSVGDIGRSWLSIHKQLLVGLETCSTEFVTIAEHDCMYSQEYFSFVPANDAVFWCNANCWLVEWSDQHPEIRGMYSYWPRRQAMSQTVCGRQLWIDYTKDRIDVLSKLAIAKTSQPVHLQNMTKGVFETVHTKMFSTRTPNLDIRHGKNFTGAKRGKARRYELPYWGKFEDVLNGKIVGHHTGTQ